jgi:hypothetical protein
MRYFIDSQSLFRGRKMVFALAIFFSSFNGIAQSSSFQFVSYSNQTTISNGVKTNVTKNQTRYFWIVTGKINNWVIIQDKPVGKSHERNYFEKFNVNRVKNNSNGSVTYFTTDENGFDVRFLINDGDINPHIGRFKFNSNGDPLTARFYYIDTD